ncbi:hypothetical protein GWK47_011585 [Chionoecetes opilio]|uniref:Uncharacterized protein n=1 Tax=Chionoecetes opilio TaxID=41210 RepID=A0A8J5C2I3_CHIOP|nr:hypothetical protein GWK47_011585 [Chionoecetes opilio]
MVMPVRSTNTPPPQASNFQSGTGYSRSISRSGGLTKKRPRSVSWQRPPQIEFNTGACCGWRCMKYYGNDNSLNYDAETAKKYKAGISPPVRRVSRQATGGSRGGVVTVRHLRHWSPGRGRQGVGDVSAGRGLLATSKITSLGVWRTMRAGPRFHVHSAAPHLQAGRGAVTGLKGGGGGQEVR